MHIGMIRFGVALAAALFAPPSAFAATDTFFDEGKAQAGLERIFEKAGHPAKILSVDIRSNQLIVEVQEPDNPQHIDSWTDWLNTGTFGWFKPESLSGPSPVELNLANRDLAANLFELKPADLALVARLGAASIKRAALEDEAHVDRMELRRQLILIPEPKSGDPEWSVEVTSERERATIYASLGGAISHANLDGTRRAQRLDYLAGGKELDEVVQSVKDTLGTAPVIRRLLVYDRTLTFVALNSDQSGRDSRFNAGLNGVYRDVDDAVANVGLPSDKPPARFAITDVDWSLLPKLQPAARERLQLPGGSISYVELSKPNNAIGEPTVQWEVHVNSATNPGVGGYVDFDAKGNVLHTSYPPGKGPKLDLFQAAGYAPAFDALSRAIGEHAATVELMFRSDDLLVTTKDPQKPDDLVVFDYAGESVARSIMPPLNWPTFGSDWFFDLSQAQPIAARWGELQQDALTRLGLADGKIDRITISKLRLYMPQNDRLLIEVRAEAGKREGRIVYDLTGKIVDIDKP